VVSSLQFALVGVNSRSSCCFARRSDSRSMRCRQVEGVPALEGDEDGGRDELDEEGDCVSSAEEALTDQK
jgi:hypothetical protein